MSASIALILAAGGNVGKVSIQPVLSNTPIPLLTRQPLPLGRRDQTCL